MSGMYITITANDLHNGEISFGFHSQEGVNENGCNFYEFVIGILFFEIIIGKNF